ncbi:homoserine dehydrogenase [Bacillus sp. DJP31]|uniref:homoserine dehydrogenase n=1 Tax=Bacillus sp. DJP31 TaxID=3409789 RepID=UPI003BB5884B
MKSIKVVLLGLGTVGKGLYETINTHQQKLHEATGLPVEIVGILVKDADKPREIKGNITITTSVEDLLALQEVDIVFEAIVGIEPANTYIKRFIEKGSHVISANKELLAHKGKELSEYASLHHRFLTFEAAVAGGIPLLRTIIQLLQVNGILKVEAILNGTSNYILSKMRKEKANFDDVLKEAQELGYAEADPSNDVLGTDAFYKLMILSNLIYQEQPSWEDAVKIGVNQVSTSDLLLGEKLGLRLKLLATLQMHNEEITAEVKPTFVGAEHPLYNVEGVNNGIVITTDLVGTILLQGPGAGSKATASAMIEDLVYIRQQEKPKTEHSRSSYHTQNQHDGAPTSVWLAVIEETTSKALKNNYSISSKLDKFNTKLLQRDVVKNETGYVIASLLQGKEENVLNYLQTLKQEKLRFYPVSTTGFSIQSHEHTPNLLQTTI